MSGGRRKPSCGDLRLKCGSLRGGALWHCSGCELNVLGVHGRRNAPMLCEMHLGSDGMEFGGQMLGKLLPNLGVGVGRMMLFLALGDALCKCFGGVC
jgi:hypothetical protein